MSYNPKNQSILQLESDWKRQYSGVFDRTKKEWLPVIREFMREETGLSMHQKRVEKKIVKDTNLNFDFIQDSEWNFLKLIDNEFPNLDFNELLALRKLNQVLNKTGTFFNSEQKPVQEFARLKQYSDDYLKANDIEKVIDKIFKSKSGDYDIFGRYTYLTGRIVIYYIPLILFARLKQLSLEFCLVITLVHEIAHAFHHSGKDKDGTTWTEMPKVNINILEGLAQYYTWRFVELYKTSHPELKNAYESTLQCQSGPYLKHNEWIENYKAEHVKQALTAIRRNKNVKYDEFAGLLNTSKKMLT